MNGKYAMHVREKNMNERDTLNTTIGLPFAKGSIQLSFNQDADLQLQWLKFPSMLSYIFLQAEPLQLQFTLYFHLDMD